MNFDLTSKLVFSVLNLFNESFAGADLSKPQANVVYLLFDDQMILKDPRSSMIKIVHPISLAA